MEWETHQLTEYLVHVSGRPDRLGAMRAALTQALEALDAEVGAITRNGEVITALGFGKDALPEEFMAAINRGSDTVRLNGQEFALLQAGLAKRRAPQVPVLIAARQSDPFTAPEKHMVQAMALVLGLVLDNLRTLENERAKIRLVQTLLALQRSISLRRPLQELLDAATSDAAGLLGNRPTALLLIDSGAPGTLMPASSCGFTGELDETTRAAVAEASSGVNHVALFDEGEWVFAEPVMIEDTVAGCLVTRMPEPAEEVSDPGELLTAFAQQVSLALADARTVDAVREAHHDSVTGLPNRSLFLQHLETARAEALAQNHALTVLFIDLDRFKAVNDALGHQCGDELLAAVARRIGDCIRRSDVAARLGGDEFSVLLVKADPKAAARVAERIIAALAEPFTIDGREVTIGASVGIAALAGHVEPAALLSDADVAMYFAKRCGGGRAAVFEQRMVDDVAGQLAMRADLRHAIELNELWLAYQPIVDIRTGKACRVEGLMRWTHPERGLVGPDVFIPLAEENDLIITLGAWAIHQGLSDLARWRRVRPDLGISLNVSVRQLGDPNLARVIAKTLEQTKLPPDALTLEITESVLMADPRLAHRQLTELKNLGIRLAIDDFGTGYSSLAYLHRLPVDDVKIDRSFVSGLRRDSLDDIAMVRSVVSLCKTLRLRTVAEGIEDEEQQALLIELGCDLGQGYLFARPMPAQALAAKLRSSRNLTYAGQPQLSE